jgi:2-iminobutanoate/2-iminopropanoate deaminase
MAGRQYEKMRLASRDGEQSMANRIHDIGIARQIGTYSDAVETPANARWLVTAGTPGLGADGKVPPDFGAQAELAWSHIVTMLKRADMSVHDLVKVTQYLVRPSDIAAYAEVRAPSRRRATGLAAADRAEFGAARVPVGDRGVRGESVTP